MKLVIAEKPSLARAIMTALGEKFSNKGEYYQSGSYYVVPLHGHILETVDMEKYSENKGKNMWQRSNLPFFPKRYKYQVQKGEKKTLDAIKKLISQKNVTEIIHCGDPDREGQVIVDLVLMQLKNTKKVTRPLLKATTPDAINKAFDERKDNSNYELWRDEGLTRSYMDWDYGINLSRYAYAKTKVGLNIGRVIGAIVTEIYNRDKEIEEFVPEKYFKIESDEDGIKLTSKKKPKDKKEAEDYCKALNGEDAIVKSLDTKRVKKPRPKLFSQTNLQGEASKRFSLKPKDTLSVAQKLYEKGLTTYPRTNTNYIAEGEKSFVEGVIKKIDDGHLSVRKEPFDDSKVDGHSAIMPTGKQASLNGAEEKVYNMIKNRFMAVFCKEECTVDRTTAKISVGKIEDFTVSGEISVTPGWKRYEGKAEDKPLPKLKVGQKIKHAFKAFQTETKPPAHYNVDSLGKWMEDPFRKSDEDEADYKNILAGLQIGTEATRAGIIDKAIKKNYIDLTDKIYTIQQQGKFLVESAEEMGIDMSKEKTAEMGKYTKEVSQGKKTKEEVLKIVRKEITDIVGSNKNVTGETSSFKCPKCGKALKDEYMKLSCSCGFELWKVVAKRRLMPNEISDLLTKGKTEVLSGLKGKKGAFSARLVLNGDKTEFEFPEREEIGKCPLCGRPVYENKKAYGCSGWKDGCGFVIWKTSKYPKAKISKSQAMTLLKEGKVEGRGFKAEIAGDKVELTEK